MDGSGESDRSEHCSTGQGRGGHCPATRRNGLNRRETRSALLFISPWIIGFLLFTAWPVIYTAYLSLTDYDVINDPSFVGTANFERLLQDPKVALALKDTFVFAALSVPAQLLVSLALALLLDWAGRATGFFLGQRHFVQGIGTTGNKG